MVQIDDGNGLFTEQIGFLDKTGLGETFYLSNESSLTEPFGFLDKTGLGDGLLVPGGSSIAEPLGFLDKLGLGDGLLVPDGSSAESNLSTIAFDYRSKYSIGTKQRICANPKLIVDWPIEPNRVMTVNKKKYALGGGRIYGKHPD